MSLQAYRSTQVKTQDPRQLEYLLFAEITRDLIRADEANDRSELSRVLHRNMTLWQTLGADCADETNQMPAEIRAGIISLGIWVEKHTRAIRQGKQPLAPLIRVNKTIMEGLRPKATSAAA